MTMSSMDENVAPGSAMPTAQAEAVAVRGLSHRYDERSPFALEDVDLSVANGSFVCVIGPSGCGKSTLLSVLGGLISPTAGTVQVAGVTIVKDGRRVSYDPPPVGYVFQDHRLLPWRSVAENIEIVLHSAGVPNDKWDGLIDQYLNMLRIGRFREAWPLQLSGGQRQRVAIARALAIDPSVILMDEPFSTLDEVTARFLRKELVDLWERSNATVIFVTHSVREAVYLADEVVIFTNGPGKVAEKIIIELPRPRNPEDPDLAALESKLIGSVLKTWGYHEGQDYS